MCFRERVWMVNPGFIQPSSEKSSAEMAFIYYVLAVCSLSPLYMHTNTSSPKLLYFNLSVTIVLSFLETDAFFCSLMCVELIVSGCCLRVCVCMCTGQARTITTARHSGILSIFPHYFYCICLSRMWCFRCCSSAFALSILQFHFYL